MDLTGQKLGKYELTQRLGSGGMADVYKACQPIIDRTVAIKVMQPQLAGSGDFVERFRREAQRLGSLRHPNIVSVLDFDIVDEINFLVMDFVAGQTLLQYLEGRHRLPLEETLRIASQVLDALGYAHSRGVIHCDLKPGNVMFLDETRRQVVLTDFGIARIVDTASGHAQTSTLIGTPAYMSPEVLQSQPFDGRADLYSLGVMLHEMVTGEQPYVGDTPVSVVIKHLQEPPPDLRRTHPELPEAFAALVEKALAKDPAQRYQNAAEMRQAVDLLLRILQRPELLMPTSQPLAGDDTLLKPGQARSAAPHTGPYTTQPANAPGGPASGPLKPSYPAPASGPFSPPHPAPASGPVPAPPPARRNLFLWGSLAALILLCVAASGAGLTYWGWKQYSAAPAIAQATRPPTQPAANASPTTPPATAGTSAGNQAAPAATTSQDVPEVEANRFGSLTFSLDTQGAPANLLILLDSVARPPEGLKYVAWAGDGSQFQKLGDVSVQDGRGYLLLNVGTPELGQISQARITLEADGSNASAPGETVVFSGEFSPEQMTAFQQLAISSSEATGKPYAAAILEQTLQAAGHQLYLADALTGGDLEMARAHAEHVINIMEGKDGPDFGDLDGNGRPENPGDDVGVQRYIEGARQHLLAFAAAPPQTRLRQSQTGDAAGQLEDAQQAIQQLIDIDRQFLAATTDEERLPLAGQGRQMMLNLLYGENGLGGLWQASQDSLQAISLPLIAAGGQVAFQPPATDDHPAARLSLDQAGDLILQLQTLPPAPSGFVYTLWAQPLSGGDPEVVGTAAADESEIGIDLSADDLFNGYGSLQLSMDAEDAAPSATGRLVLSGAIDQAAANLLSSLSTPRGDGALDNALLQAEAAGEHRDYLFQALQDGDLALAKRHAEHVINILEGPDGPHYGDVNGDGNSQDHSDGIGVLGYLEQINTLLDSLPASNLSSAQEQRLEEMRQANQHTAEIINQCYEAAAKVFASDTIEEAQANAASFSDLVQAVLTGLDSDSSGAIDPQLGEGGLQAIHDLAAALRQVELYR